MPSDRVDADEALAIGLVNQVCEPEALIGNCREDDVVARYGGEEFAILLPQTDLRSAHSLAREIGAGIAASPLVLDGGEAVTVTVSVGVASLPADDRRVPREAGEAMLKAADAAAYGAKMAGRNCVVCADA